MLADESTSRPLGQLAPGVLVKGCSRAAILDFILDQLPLWRDRLDRTERSPHTKETTLTSRLCAHLNSASRKAPHWDCLQFRVEEEDETHPSRKIDLAAAAVGDALIVEGRSYNDFEMILPIECKRLPTPNGAKRDEREYVITRIGVRGGIQRYKEGMHGAAHVHAGMIAYVQQQNFDYWFSRIRGWIQDLYTTGSPGWSPADALVAQKQDSVAGIAVYESEHSRVGRSAIHLRHLWVRMA